MAYRPLPYHQYFIDNSEDRNHLGTARRKVHYRAVTYACHGLPGIFGLKHEMNYEIFYEEDRNVIQLNFQKTTGWTDWFANVAEFSSRYYDSIDFCGEKLQLRVHHGWAEMYMSIKYEVREQWKAIHDAHPDAVTEVVGWSLGSAQAILCTQDLNYNFGVRPYLYTFGSVKPFRYTSKNRDRTLAYLRGTYSVCYNFAIRNDLVTYMPPFRGYTMLHRVELAREKRTLKKLLNPGFYHTIYDRENLYREAERETRV